MVLIQCSGSEKLEIVCLRSGPTTTTDRALGWAAERSSSRALFILLEGVDDDYEARAQFAVFGFSFVRVVVHVVAKYYDISWPLSALARPFSVRLWASCRPELWVLVLSDTTSTNEGKMNSCHQEGIQDTCHATLESDNSEVWAEYNWHVRWRTTPASIRSGGQW